MKKRILSLLLTLAMVLTLAPVAFAAGDDAAQDANSVEAADTAQVEPQENTAGEDASVTTAEDTTIVENPVAKIGDTGYATLQEAVNAATKGTTIEVLQNVDLGTDKLSTYNVKSTVTGVTVDLGGYTVSGAGQYLLYLRVNDWTIQNGTISYTNANSSYGALAVIGGYNSTTLKNVTINSESTGVFYQMASNKNGLVVNVTVEDGTKINGTYGVVMKGQSKPYGSTRDGQEILNVNGGEISGSIAGIAVYGAAKGNTKAGVVVNVAGGKISSDAGYAIAGNGNPVLENTTVNISGGEVVSAKDTAIYHPQAGTVSISGGKVSGVTGGVQMCAGSLNVTGGTITATGNGDVSGKTGDGSIPDGAAVSVVNRNYPGGTPSATISGGTLTSASGVGAVQAYTWTNNAKADWAEAKSNTSISGGTFSSDVSDYVASGYKAVQDTDRNWSIEDHRVADVDGVGYTTLEAAVAAAKDSQTVKLLKDVETTEEIKVNTNIILDLNGKTFEAKLPNNSYLSAMEANGENASITLQDSSEGAKGKLISNYYGLSARDDGKLVVNSGTIESDQSALTGNNTTGNMNFVVNGGTLSAKHGGAIYQSGQCELTVTGGTLNGGIALRMGQVNISGGTINATTGDIDDPAQYYNYSGSVWFPDALYVIGGTYTSKDATYGNSLNLNITGGTFNCTNGKGSAVAIYDCGKVAQNAKITISGNAKFTTNAKNRGAYDVLSLSDIGVTNPKTGYNNAELVGKVSSVITGGTFSSDVNQYCAPGYKTELTNGVYVVKAGTNDALSAIDAALEAVKNDEDVSEDATKKAVQDALTEVAAIPNETLSGNSTTMDKLAQLDAAAQKGGIEVKVTSIAADHKTVTAENAALSADPAKTGEQQTVTITVKDKEDTTAVTKAQEAAGATAELGANALDITMNVNGETVTTPSAPVVLTFALPDGWANAKIVRVDGDNTEIVPSTISNGTISGVFNHFSTYVLVQTEAAKNLNQYEFVLTPNKTDVSANDELTYTVTLKHTAGKDTDKVGYFIFAPTIANKDLLELDATKTTANNAKKVFFGKASGTYEFTLTDGGVDLAVGESMDVGTLVYKVKAYDTDKAAVLVTGGTKDQVTNVRYQTSLTPTVSITNGVTYHVTKVTFQQDDKTADKVYYAKYGTSELYEKADLTGDTVSVAKPTDTSTEYRLADEDWHLSTDLNQIYKTNTEFKESVTYVTKKIPLVKITIPADVVEVPGTEAHPVTDRTDGKYVDKTEDLTFTVKPAPTPGERYDVTVKVDGKEVTPVKNDDGSYTVPGELVTGEVSFEHKSVLDLDEDDIYIFTDGEGETLAYRKYSAYSGDDTLVLIKGKTNVNYTLNAGQPTIYKTAAYKDLNNSYGYTHAVLVPGKGTVSKQAMLAYLKEQGLKVTETKNTVISTTSWDTNGNKNTSRDLGDVQATNDFKTYPESEDWNWTPTDDLLLLADVLTIEDETSDVYVKGSYTQLRDGRVSDDDVNAFVYLYAKLGK